MQSSKDFDVRLGTMLRIHREAAGIKATDVARALGVNRSTITFYETGRNAMSASVLLDYCRAIGLDPAELIKLVKE